MEEKITSSSDHSSVYKRGETDRSSVNMNYTRKFVWLDELCRSFILTDDLSVCPCLYTEELFNFTTRAGIPAYANYCGPI